MRTTRLLRQPAHMELEAFITISPDAPKFDSQDCDTGCAWWDSAAGLRPSIRPRRLLTRYLRHRHCEPWCHCALSPLDVNDSILYSDSLQERCRMVLLHQDPVPRRHEDHGTLQGVCLDVAAYRLPQLPCSLPAREAVRVITEVDVEDLRRVRATVLFSVLM